MNTLSKSTLVIIVSYNPDIDLLKKNIAALNIQFEHILIVDNNSANISDIEMTAKSVSQSILIKKLPENTGIAHAQNVGLKTAVKKGLEWILTMDQDSVIPSNLSKEYEKIIAKYSNTGLVGWNMRDNPEQEIMEKDWFVVSSGCLMNTGVLSRLGGFDDDLFIDHVDTDVNMKIRNAGYKTITTSKVRLYHRLGEETDKKTIRGAVYHAHPPTRVYYIIRNGVVIFKRNFFKQPLWSLQAIKNGVREGIYLLYHQDNKLQNIGIIFRAWFDGLFNRLGKFGGK